MEVLKLTDVIEQLNDQSFEWWKNMNKENWEKYLLSYNYLNPRRQGNDVLILRNQ